MGFHDNGFSQQRGARQQGAFLDGARQTWHRAQMDQNLCGPPQPAVPAYEDGKLREMSDENQMHDSAVGAAKNEPHSDLNWAT